MIKKNLTVTVTEAAATPDAAFLTLTSNDERPDIAIIKIGAYGFIVKLEDILTAVEEIKKFNNLKPGTLSSIAPPIKDQTVVGYAGGSNGSIKLPNTDMGDVTITFGED